ncbi:MAG: RNA polymerase sigma factor [Cyclobacteriaceae bacterium]|nr:RNA polymerase sigma factor [Cyclobacteriaceae bacterium]
MQLSLELKQQTIERERLRLLNFIKGRVSSLEDAEDILQEVLFAFVDRSPVETAEKAVAWLFSVARNKIIDKYRKKNIFSASIDQVIGNVDQDEPIMMKDILPDLGPDPHEVYLQNVIWEKIVEALEELPSNQRDIFIQNELEGRGFKEISEEMGISINTLLSRKRYAVLALREKLEELYKDMQ